MIQKKKTYKFTTDITPEINVCLNGCYGHPLSLCLDDGTSSVTVKLDTQSIIGLQDFLADYLQKDEVYPYAPTYEPTGRALAIMDGSTLDIVRVFKTKSVPGIDGTETDSYDALCDRIRNTGDIELPPNAIFIFFDTFERSISLNVIRRVLRACIAYQKDFVCTGDLSKCRRMILNDIADFTTIDISVISRATSDVIIRSSAGTFTLNSSESLEDAPSLFDSGSLMTNGKYCSRKYVLAVISKLIEEENKFDPYTDESLSDELSKMGFAVARRTVDKYRQLLGIQKRSERRVKCR